MIVPKLSCDKEGRDSTLLQWRRRGERGEREWMDEERRSENDTNTALNTKNMKKRKGRV